MSEKLSRAVGPSGRVYAVDIQPEMLALIDARAKKEGLGNVIAVLGEPDDPKLPDGRLDLELMVDVYHELQHPQIGAASSAASASAGRPPRAAGIPEGRSRACRSGEDHKMTVADAKAELEAEGFHTRRRQTRRCPGNTCLVFTRTAAREICMRSRTRCTSCPGVNGFCSSVIPGFSTRSRCQDAVGIARDEQHLQRRRAARAGARRAAGRPSAA